MIVAWQLPSLEEVLLLGKLASSCLNLCTTTAAQPISEGDAVVTPDHKNVAPDCDAHDEVHCQVLVLSFSQHMRADSQKCQLHD